MESSIRRGEQVQKEVSLSEAEKAAEEFIRSDGFQPDDGGSLGEQLQAGENQPDAGEALEDQLEADGYQPVTAGDSEEQILAVGTQPDGAAAYDAQVLANIFQPEAGAAAAEPVEADGYQPESGEAADEQDLVDGTQRDDEDTSSGQIQVDGLQYGVEGTDGENSPDIPLLLEQNYVAEEVPALQQPDEATPTSNDETLSNPLPSEAPVETSPRKIALILSGGGARGAFQVGAEKYTREVRGFHWDIIAGVSVGALNGAMLAMHRYARLMEIWDNISNEQVYTGGFNVVSLVKLLLGAKSFYSIEPLHRMMKRELEAGRVIDDLHVGAVSLVSGEYQQFTKDFLELPNAILASASMPVVWPPVDISPEHQAMVDGGIRNITPIGDVLDLEPDEIVIINCGMEKPTVLPQAPDNVLSIGVRTLDIMLNEIFTSDMNEFVRINGLVKEAEQQGCVLHHPRTGKPLKYYPCHIIEPDGDLCGVLDFSKKAVQEGLKAGVRRAREVLGRH